MFVKPTKYHKIWSFPYPREMIRNSTVDGQPHSDIWTNITVYELWYL